MTAPGVTETLRCSALSRTRGDEVAGTASTVRRFLLVQHPGPWGVSALRDAPMSEEVRAHLQVPGTRTLLIRRHGRQRSEGVAVLLADVPTRTLVRADLDRLDDVVGLDVSDPHAPGWRPDPDGLVGACTHGRHDACCAERGRPVAAALAEHGPDVAWEVSHIGGDRFAGNVVVLPEGLYYGRVEPGDVPALLADRAAGRVHLDRLRGRTDLPMPAQYADAHLRRTHDALALDDVRYVGRDGDAHVFTVRGEQQRVVVEQVMGEPDLLTCRAQRDNRVPGFRVLAG